MIPVIKFQKKTVRIITNMNYNQCFEELFSKLDHSKWSDILQISAEL